jgi:hypothetical protein
VFCAECAFDALSDLPAMSSTAALAGEYNKIAMPHEISENEKSFQFGFSLELA